MATGLTLLGLEVLRHVAASGSFAGAAEELGYTQSAVSRQMAALERAVGEALFVRGRRGVLLTPAGEVVLAGAQRTAGEVEAVQQRLAGLRDRLAGRLVVGAYPTAAAVLVPRAVAALLVDHPALEVVLDEAATPVLLRRVRAKRLDLAVVAVGADLPDHDLAGLVSHPLPTVGLHIAVPGHHRLARRRVVRPSDLVGERWIVGVEVAGEPQFGAWPTVRDPDVAHRVRHWTTRLGLVAAGLGITVLPGTMAGAVPEGVRVLAVDDPTWPGRTGVVITRIDPGPVAASAVRALVHAAAAMRDARD